MTQMIPFTPHLAYECLELMGQKNTKKWPIFQQTLDETVKLAVQINGKTRDVMEIKKDLEKEEVHTLIKNESRAKKYFEKEQIIRTIFVKNKIINFIIKK